MTDTTPDTTLAPETNADTPERYPIYASVVAMTLLPETQETLDQAIAKRDEIQAMTPTEDTARAFTLASNFVLRLQSRIQ